MQDRLAVRIWVEALIRRASLAGASAFVVRHGDDERGDVLIRVSRLNGQGAIYAPVMTPEGSEGFVNLEIQGIGPDDAAIDAYVLRASGRDRDLWVVEIEDRDGRHFLTEAVIEPPSPSRP